MVDLTGQPEAAEAAAMKTLVVGWFSFEGMKATAGDLLARDVVCDWLTRSGRRWDIAVASPYKGGPHWLAVDPANYTSLVFVCGPMAESPLTSEIVRRFAHCRLIGIDLTMTMPLDKWNPFDVLYERDSSAHARPDLVFLSEPQHVPIVGVVLVHPQPMYGSRAMHPRANELIAGLTDAREMAVVRIDTCIEDNAGGLRTPAEIESLIARMDVVLTTRLHGTVLALKHGIPVIAVDPIAEGAKVLRQAAVLGWPLAFDVATTTPEQLSEAFDFCLTSEARLRARQISKRAVAELRDLRDEFMAVMATPDAPGDRRILLGPPARPEPPEPPPVAPPAQPGPGWAGRFRRRRGTLVRRVLRVLRRGGGAPQHPF